MLARLPHRSLGRSVAITLVALGLFSGCGSAPPAMAEAPSAPHDMGGPSPAAPMAGDAGAPAPSPGQAPMSPKSELHQVTPAAPGAPAGAKSATQEGKSSDKASQALILYTGEVALTVDADRVAATIDAAVDAAESVGGHLAGRTNDTVKVKVPSARFREGLQKIEKLGLVTNEVINAEDVTAEYKDAEVRLENLRATRKRLEEFLAKAGTMTDMLTVERELERVAKEMDVLSGRLRFLKEHTAFSVLTVRLTAKPKTVPVVVQTPPPPPPPPPPRAIDLPVSWFGSLGVDELLRLPAPKK